MATVQRAESADEPKFPRSWMWEDDGDVVAGTFVRFDAGPTRGYGKRPITVLTVDDEERSVWLLETALFNQFRDELADRPNRTLKPGERVVIRRGEKRKTEDGARSYRGYKVLFPDRPEPVPSALFDLDKRDPAAEEEPAAENGSGPLDDGDGDIPF